MTWVHRYDESPCDKPDTPFCGHGQTVAEIHDEATS